MPRKNRLKTVLTKALITILSVEVLLIVPLNVQAVKSPKAKEIITVGEEPVVSDLPNNTPVIEPRGIVTSWQVSKSYDGMNYGGWVTYGNRKKSKSTGTIAFTVKTKVYASYSGSVKVGIKKVEATLGFSVSNYKEYSMTNTWNCKKNTEYKVQYRKRYKTYKVTQKRTDINSWTGQIYTKKYYVTVKKPDGIDVRVVES
ncbi:hypothetical protein [Listeria sp. PSOL-1]|uniref:hypothetical protein n=1 Tax=Listeria sp. PSOL-1 TaxID=1844999 RepID=UPI0013D00855|nr:hypothetical protein [Listeria sp. PSOL-1]